MNTLRTSVDYLIQLCGITGHAVPIVRHITLIVIVVLLAVISYVVCKHLVPLIIKLASRNQKQAHWIEVLLDSLCRIVPALVVWSLLPLVFSQFPAVQELVARLTAAYVTIMTMRAAMAFLKSFDEEDAQAKVRSAKRQYLKSFRGVLNIIIVFVGTVVTFAILIGKNPATLFAGLGATSAILMLVFQDTITGLVAGIRLTSNDMVHRGDWITVPSTDVNGIVEDITLTTVKVRNFDNTIVTITPQKLVNGTFQNWIGMQESGGRRVKRLVYYDFRSIKLADAALKASLVGGGYFTAKELEGDHVNLTLYRAYMERYLASRDDVNTQMTLMVRQLEATNTGLPVEFYFFLKQKVWVDYEHHLAEIMEHIYAITPVFGLTIYQQYPEQ